MDWPSFGWGFGAAWVCFALWLGWLMRIDDSEVEKLRREADDHLEIDA